MKPYLEFDRSFEGLEPSSTLYINETVNERWQRGETVYHMGFGESRFDVHPLIQDALTRHADKKSYLAAKGLKPLCDMVARYYSEKLDSKFSSHQVIVGPGSKALIYGLQMVLNADLFLPTPSWVSYAPQAKLLGRQFHYIASKPEDNYELTIEALDQRVKQSSNPCKLLVINSPNNPTGQILTENKLKEIASYCKDNGIWVLSDEIYFEVTHGQGAHHSISKYYPEGTFVLGGLSKHLSIGGWRLGIGLLPDTPSGKEIMNKLTVLASEVWSGVASPVQYAAIEAYSQHEELEAYVTECREIHGIRTRFFNQALTNLGIQCTRPEGGFYIAPNFDQFKPGLERLGIETSADLARYLLERHAIAALPGKDFGIPEKTQTLRLSTSYLDFETEFDAQRLLGLYRQEDGVKTFMSEENHPNMHAALQAFSDFVDSIK